METIEDLDKLLNKSTKVLKVQLTFVVTVLKPVYDSIKVLQKESGKLLDVMDIFHKYVFFFVEGHVYLCTCFRFKASLQKMQRGELPYEVTRITKNMPQTDAKKVGEGFAAACQV